MRTVHALVLVAFATMACEVGSCGGVQRAASPPPAPSAPAPSVATSAAVAPTTFELASLTALTAAPAFAPVRAALYAKDPRGAADAIDAALKAGKIAAADLDRARFLLGSLAQKAKDDDRADAAYGAVSKASPLRPHAALRRATFAAKKGRVADALALLDEVPDAAPFATDRHFALGDARTANGEHSAAADAYAPERKGPRAFEAAIRWAEEIAASSRAADALEAATGVRRVRFEHATSSLAARAEEAERRCRALLTGKDAIVAPPSAAEEAAAAQAYLDAGKPKDALPIAARAMAADKKGSAAWCRAAHITARAHERVRDRTKASDAYNDVINGCTDEAVRVVALYDGAKVALGAKLPEVSRARFALLEKDYPKHRLADDARLRSALALIDAGDVAKGEAMLASLPDDYPEGDMRTEALFRLALPRMKKGDWAGATPYLEKSLSIAPREEGYFVAGRAQYFLGRARLEQGNADGAAKLQEVIVKEPLTFAAAMAYARLAARSPADGAAAKKALEQAIASEPEGALFDATRPETRTPAFARGVELARIGESELARKELAAAGLLESATTDPGAQWLVAAIFARAGDARVAHNFPRGRLPEWNAHFPAGKWRAAWELAFPRAYQDLVEEAATRDGVPGALVWAVMREESAFDPDAVSPSAAYGLLQLILPTAAHYAKPLKLPSDAHALVRPDINITLGTSYLRKLRADFPDNPGLAVPSYNAGEGATRRWMSPPLADSFDLWVESIPYDETRKYTKRVLASYWAYVALYEPARLDAELRGAAGK